MITKISLALICGFIFSLAIFAQASAHPGNTASDGCHYCRTNCDKWGVPWNERHCHGDSSNSPSGSNSSDSEEKEKNYWPWIIGAGVTGYIAYAIYSNKDN